MELALIKKLRNTLSYPARHDAPFLLLIWGLLVFPEFMVQIAKTNYFYSFLYLLLYFGVAYLCTFIVDFYSKWRKGLKVIFFLIVSLYTILNVYCLYTYRTRLTYNFIEIIAATNWDETREYLQMYVGFKQYAIIFFGFLILWVLFFISNRLSGKFQINLYFTEILVSMSICSIFINPTLKDEFVTWNFNFEDVADLRKYMSDPALTYDIDSLPQYIVLILGESHAKSHSSLYGYEKITNPLLKTREEKGNLFVFKNVESPATNTSNSFKYILNTHRLDSPSKEKWFKSVNLIEVLKKAGYNTAWISNQAQKGLYNNLSSAPALLCDTAVFIREFSNDKKYDSELADISLPIHEEKNAFIYHLMGQHILFNERYPETFEKFTETEYLNTGLSAPQRQNIAYYDNANLYNDFTINSIIKKFEDKDAIVFYFPDHGLDVYETDPEYCGHALPNPASQYIGKEIPFMIFLSEEFKKKHQNTPRLIAESIDKHFCTDKFIYTVMDVAGIRFSENEDVAKYSLLN